MTRLVADDVQLKIMVSPDFKETVEAALGDHGTNLKTGLTRLLEWYLNQPTSVQAAIISKAADANAEITRLKLAEMKTVGQGINVTAKMDINDAVRVIRAMADRIEIDIRSRKGR